jgi:hypothetical protein
MSWIEYKSVFTASQYVTPVAEEVTQGFYNIKWAAESAGGAMEQTGMRSFNAFRNLAFSAQMGLFYVSMLESGMMRMESASIGVEMAQERLNDVIKKSGANSDEAHRAMQTLERAQIMYQRTAMYSNLMTISLGIQFVSFASSIEKFAAPALLRITGLTEGLTKAFWGLQASLGWTGIALLAIGAIAAVGVGAYAYSQSRVALPETLNINAKTDVDEVLELYKQRLKRAITQGGSP